MLLFIGTRAAAATHQTKHQTWQCWFVHLILSVRAALFRSASDEVKLEPHRKTRVEVDGKQADLLRGVLLEMALLERAFKIRVGELTVARRRFAQLYMVLISPPVIIRSPFL